MTFLCAVALVADFSASAAAQRPSAAPIARMIDVDGHAVRVQTLGLDQRRPGSPVVVLEAGAMQGLDVWSGVIPHMAADAPVVAYSRAGLGGSEWDSVPPTPQHVAKRLRRLLEQINAKPPYVLVGYSWGGILARYFAGYHPNDVVGMVFVDPGPIVTQSLADNLDTFNAIGAGQAGYDAYWSGFGALFERETPPMRAEIEVFRRLMDREVWERDLRKIPDVPIVVIVAAKYLPLQGMTLPYDPRSHFEADVRHRMKMLQEWALAASRGTLVLSNATTHAVPREDPDLIVWAVRRVLRAVANRP